MPDCGGIYTAQVIACCPSTSWNSWFALYLLITAEIKDSLPPRAWMKASSWRCRRCMKNIEESQRLYAPMRLVRHTLAVVL